MGCTSTPAMKATLPFGTTSKPHATSVRIPASLRHLLVVVVVPVVGHAARAVVPVVKVVVRLLAVAGSSKFFLSEIQGCHHKGTKTQRKPASKEPLFAGFLC